MSEPTEFGKLLREARVEAGYATVAGAARQVGMQFPNYWALEQRGRHPQHETVRRLIVGLRLPLERFFPDDLILEAAARVRKSKRKAPK